MSKIEVDAIDKQSGSTLTLGGSGTAVTLASGATQSGFGRTGTVDWQTSIKTSGFTAVSGEGYFCNTTGGAFTVTLPASPSAGDIVAVKDYAGTFGTNNLTLGRNSSNIEGQASDRVLSTESISITFVYADATKGWLAVNDMNEIQAPKFITATGGTITTVCTNFKVHTFTGPGSFTVTCAGNGQGNNKVSYMVVAGGGSGGSGYTNNTGKAGGGGAGGFRESKASTDTYTASPLNATSGPTHDIPITAQTYPITVGGGGSAPSTTAQVAGNNGNTSTFSSITSAGGGGGGAEPDTSPPGTGQPGGSGGGGAYDANRIAGTGNTPPVSPAQGTNGGTGTCGSPYSSGGGGGATVAGTNATGPASGPGGTGATTNITASPVAYAGGGGGAGRSISPNPSTKGTGGTGGGGAGGCRTGPTSATPGVAGTANTGGGGGAGNPSQSGTVSAGSVAGAGGSGVVVIRYKFQ
jgi:hypothetical protein